MVNEAEVSSAESIFLHSALAKGLRTDGRGVYDYRKLAIRFGDELGWVDCTLGETRCVISFPISYLSTNLPPSSSVVALVTAEIVAPLPDRPYEGFLALTTEISPLASESFESNRYRLLLFSLTYFH